MEGALGKPRPDATLEPDPQPAHATAGSEFCRFFLPVNFGWQQACQASRVGHWHDVLALFHESICMVFS